MRIDIVDFFLDPHQCRDLISQFSDIRFNTWNPYERDVYKNGDLDVNIRVGMTSELAEYQREWLDEKILNVSQDVTKQKLKILRAYVNAFRDSDVCLPHYDYNHTTALIYLNYDYDVAYGGETKFYKDDELYAAVSPKPGRLVMFDGNILHAPTPFNRLYTKDFRYTIAYKLGENDG